MKKEYLENILIRNTGGHRFIDIADFKSWKDVIQDLLNAYGTFQENEPSAVFIPKFGDHIENSNDSTTYKIRILNEYYRYLIAINLAEHLSCCPDIENAVLTTFRFGDKCTDISSLLLKLRQDLLELKNNCELKEPSKIYEPKIKFLSLDSLSRNIEMENQIKWFCNLYIDAINIDFNSALLLNNYLSSRIGGNICFNIIYDSSIGYPTYEDQSGVLIENIHDFNLIKLSKTLK